MFLEISTAVPFHRTPRLLGGAFSPGRDRSTVSAFVCIVQHSAGLHAAALPIALQVEIGVAVHSLMHLNRI